MEEMRTWFIVLSEESAYGPYAVRPDAVGWGCLLEVGEPREEWYDVTAWHIRAVGPVPEWVREQGTRRIQCRVWEALTRFLAPDEPQHSPGWSRYD